MKFSQLYRDIKTAIAPSIVSLVIGAGLSYLINYQPQKYQINFIYTYAEKESKLEEKVKEAPKAEANIKFDQYLQYIKSEKSFNYKVKQGDTLNRISHHFFTLYTGRLIPSEEKKDNYSAQLKNLNKLNSNSLVHNQIIKISPPRRIRNYKNSDYSKNIETFLKLSRVLDKDSMVITSDYGDRIHPIYNTKRLHDGIDVSARPGSYVRPIFNGKVIFTGRLNGYGNTVIIESKNYEYLYAHLDSINVKEGQKVKISNVLGIMGSSGDATAPSTHLSISRNKTKGKIDLPANHSINPYAFLSKNL